MTSNNTIIKSKERVRDLAEVFTAEKEVNAMLDLVKLQSKDIQSTFFEPSCGDGNFLVAILERKLNTIKIKHKKQADVEFYIIKATSSIYGVDISEDNIKKARRRMLKEIENFYSQIFNIKKSNGKFWESLNWVLQKNIIVGDMLNRINEVVFIEYVTLRKYEFKIREFKLIDQLDKKEKTISWLDIDSSLNNYKICNYQELCF